jgi:putative ABC transport system ATP-binding protein
MTPTPENDVLRAHGLHYAYDGSPALQDVSLDIGTGEIVAVTGPRGSGKTTLLSCLSGQFLAEQGEIWFKDLPVHTLSRSSREQLRRDHFGWVGSEPQLIPELTAWENTALPLLLAGRTPSEARSTAKDWLDRLDIGDCARKRPAALLQAQRQRVAIARALTGTPSVLFADEPTAPLHQPDRAHVLRTLTAAARSHGITMVLATDEPAVVGDPDSAWSIGPTLADRNITLHDGKVESQGRRAVRRPLSEDAGDAPQDHTTADREDNDNEGRDACSLSV